MAKKIVVNGYDAFIKAISQYSDSSASVFVLFSGGAKDESGQSWCPDCVAAKPIIEEGLKSAPDDGIFIYCNVGNRPYWKDPNNDFRKDEKLKLTCVPTLIKWNTVRRLEEDQCKSAALVTMLFED